VVAPVTKIARSAVRSLARRLPAARLEPYSLESFLADLEAPGRIVLVPAGRRLAEDLEFVRSVRRRVLWPAPSAALAGAIAGLRGSHDDRPGRPPRRSGSSALLLEGDVTPDRARSAAAAGAPRDWIVERVQRVRIREKRLDELRRRGIRWAVLDPVEVVALAARDSFADARRLWGRLLPARVAVWRIPAARGARVDVRGSR
jgi:hypothetical protein